jgi:hypothetical protein
MKKFVIGFMILLINVYYTQSYEEKNVYRNTVAFLEENNIPIIIENGEMMVNSKISEEEIITFIKFLRFYVNILSNNIKNVTEYNYMRKDLNVENGIARIIEKSDPVDMDMEIENILQIQQIFVDVINKCKINDILIPIIIDNYDHDYDYIINYMAINDFPIKKYDFIFTINSDIEYIKIISLLEFLNIIIEIHEENIVNYKNHSWAAKEAYIVKLYCPR